jgi:hypothetical protein
VNPEQYEQIASRIANSIFEQVEGIKAEQVKYGRRNRWPGASGYPHQIDVSVQAGRNIWIAECKFWNRKLSTESVLTFAARCDIRGKLPQETKLYLSLVTTKGFQSGADVLAKFFEIGPDTVSSVNEFVFKYKQAIAAAVADQVTWRDEVNRALGPEGTAEEV